MDKSRLVLISLSITVLCCSWGFYAHKKINETAVFLLPIEIAPFYKKHIKIITEKAVDADKRCYIDTIESPRHYIDIDKFDNIDSIPIHWSNAKEKYGERQLLASGIIPWQINKTYQNLIKAFQSKNSELVIKYSADMGHYIADAHVPLHTTSNYNGQLTNQIGIHAFWETRLPEMFAEKYDFLIGPAEYIEDPINYAWNIVKESNQLVDSVLLIEKRLSNQFQPSLIRSYLQRNNQLVLTYSDNYAIAYHTQLKGMVENRMRKSIHAVACLWYSAWIDAGQPKLSKWTTATTMMTDSTNSTNQSIIGRQEWH